VARPMRPYVLRPKPIGHRYGDRQEALDQSRSLTGHTAGEVATAVGLDSFNESPSAKGKTGVGALVERYMGKAADSLKEPDLPEIGVEVKSLPMKRRGKGWTVKEPTSITMIDYFVVAREDWEGAYVRRKLDSVLWFPYEHNSVDKRLAKFRRPFLWHPEESDLPVMEADYRVVKSEVLRGRAHELSESLSKVLGARRKGEKGSMRPQPFSQEMARSRAWALKAAYTRPILQDQLGRVGPSIIQLGEVRSLGEVESFVAQRLSAVDNKPLGELAVALGLDLRSTKDAPARLVKTVLGLPSRGQVVEFEKLGVRLHTVWANYDYTPWEAVSFPAMSLVEFAQEEWSDSDLRDHIDNILFIPMFSSTRVDRGSRVLGRPFFWSPTIEEEQDIRKEWARFQAAVNEGKATYHAVLDARGAPLRDKQGRPMRRNRLPPMTETRYVHMRPHARDSSDTDVDPKGGSTTKQCFWLNKGFLKSILQRAGCAPASPE
jgi:DNA mismatch repair protein MutH